MYPPCVRVLCADRHGVSAAIADKVAQKIAKSLQENYSGTSGNY